MNNTHIGIVHPPNPSALQKVEGFNFFLAQKNVTLLAHGTEHPHSDQAAPVQTAPISDAVSAAEKMP